jgi:hypothetical protein
MLRLTPRRNRRAPNALAILGAFLLAASLLAGAGHSLPSARQQAGVQQTAEADTLDAATPAQPEAENPLGEAAVTQTRKFRVNLFLFRH